MKQFFKIDKIENSYPKHKSQIWPRDYIMYMWIGEEGSQPRDYIVASELKDPIWHSSEWQIGSFSSEATILCTCGLEKKDRSS